MFYKNKDYTVRAEIGNGDEKYYIKYHSQTDSPENEITREIFDIYVKEFSKPLENQRNEYRRHIEDGDIEYFIESGKLKANTIEDDDKLAIKYDIEAILKTCTPTQKKRFELYTQGYTLEKISQIEKCSKQSVFKSIDYVIKKLKNIFLEG